MLFPVRFIVGVGLGTGMALTMYFVGNTSNPDRAYGIMMAIQIFIFSVFAFISPYLINTWGVTGYVSAVSVCVLIITATLWWLPKYDAVHLDADSPEVEEEQEQTSKSGNALFGVLSLIAMALFQTGLFALFAFMERIGSNSSLSLEFIGTDHRDWRWRCRRHRGLAAAALAHRLGRVIPLTAALVAAMTAVYMLQEGASAASFFIALQYLTWAGILAFPTFWRTLPHTIRPINWWALHLRS